MNVSKKTISQNYFILVFKVLLVFLVNFFIYFNQKVKELLAFYYFKVYFAIIKLIGVSVETKLKSEDFILVFSFNCTSLPLHLLFVSVVFILSPYSIIKKEIFNLLKTVFLIEILNFIRLSLLILVYNLRLLTFEEFYNLHLFLSLLFSTIGLFLIYNSLKYLKKYKKFNINLL